MRRIMRTDVPGLVLVESTAAPWHFYVIGGWGTPFPVHLEQVCQSNEVRQACTHLNQAMEATEVENVENEFNERALVAAGQSPVVQRAAALQMKAVQELGSWGTALEIGAGLVKSGLLPRTIDTPEKAAVVILKGYTLSLDAVTAFDYIDVVEGRPNLRAQLVRGLVARSGKGRIQVAEQSSQRAVCIGFRPGWSPTRVEYTIEDAQRAGLVGKDNWKKYPADMLVARASVRVGRFMFADVLAGFDTAWAGDEGAEPWESIDNPDTGGTITVIEGEAREVPEETEPEWKAELAVLKRDTGVTNDDLERVLGGRPSVKSIEAWIDAEEGRTVSQLISRAADLKSGSAEQAAFATP